MWNRRRPARTPASLTIRSEDGLTLYLGAVEGMALPEALILALSVEFFNDPAPCQIHRSAVMKRVFLEVEGQLHGGGERRICDMANGCARYFAGYPGAYACRLEEGGAP